MLIRTIGSNVPWRDGQMIPKHPLAVGTNESLMEKNMIFLLLIIYLPKYISGFGSNLGNELVEIQAYGDAILSCGIPNILTQEH